jgi:hypothetical protein
VAFTNSEKQARYRERHLGVDGEKVRVGLVLNATTRAKMERLARHKGYTITALVEELIESAGRRVTTRLTGKALKAHHREVGAMESRSDLRDNSFLTRRRFAAGSLSSMPGSLAVTRGPWRRRRGCAVAWRCELRSGWGWL